MIAMTIAIPPSVKRNTAIVPIVTPASAGVPAACRHRSYGADPACRGLAKELPALIGSTA